MPNQGQRAVKATAFALILCFQIACQKAGPAAPPPGGIALLPSVDDRSVARPATLADVDKLQDATWDRASPFFSPTIEVSPNGRYMVLGGGVGDTGRLHVWDLALGQRTFLISTDLPEVMVAAFSPDSSNLVTGHMGGDVRTWRMADATVLSTRRFDQNWIRAVTFSPSGNEIAAGGQDGTLYFLDARDLRERWSVKAHFFGLSESTFSNDGLLIYTVGDDQHINIWNSTDGSPARPLRELRRERDKPHTGMVKTLRLFDDGKKGVSGAYWEGGNIKSYESIAPPDHVLRVWDMESGTPVISFPFAWGIRCCIERLADDVIGFINIDSWVELNSTVRVLDLAQNKQLGGFQDDSPFTDGYRHGVQAFSPIPGRDATVIGLRSGRYVVWNYRTNSIVGAFISTDKLWFVMNTQLRYDGSPDAVLRDNPDVASILSGGTYVRSPGLLAKTVAVTP